ncbi:MAG TPA: protease pro-enzyme activation domain-containing protein [Streptosporangiaceae bacterium]
MAVVGMSGSAGAATGPSYLRLPGSAAPFTSHTHAISAVDGATPLTIQVWTKPGNLAAAERYALAVSTPGSKFYHRYLSPDAYTARYGTSRAASAKVRAWLRSKGFTAFQTDAQRNYVRATASVAAIDAAFKVTLENYRSTARVNAGHYQLRANNKAVAIPKTLSPYVIGVTGLDNAAPKNPIMHGPIPQASGAKFPKVPCSKFYGQHHMSNLPKAFGRTSLSTQLCGYSAYQLRAAYGMNMKNDGRGQTISLVELGLAPEMFLTLKDLAASQHFVPPSSRRYTELSLGKNTCGDPFIVEEQLDVEASYEMAPGANQLTIGGDSCNNGDFGLQGLFDADLVNIDGMGNDHHPLSTISSNSWGPGNDTQPAIFTNIMHAYLVRAAAQGVGMYFASGDASGVETPDDPFTILVGGTTLGVGKHDTRLFETGWSSGFAIINTKKHSWVSLGEEGATSGGPSLLWAQPAYQRGVVPRAQATAPGNRRGLVRSQPDVSADADLFTGFSTGILEPQKKGPPKFVVFPVGGTSAASPLVAGMVADAQQGQHRAFGFTDPMLYKLSGTNAFRDVLPSTPRTPSRFRGVVCNVNFCGIPSLVTFDDQNKNLGGYTGQVTAKGYDNMTGIGTPRGQSFINALRKMG